MLNAIVIVVAHRVFEVSTIHSSTCLKNVDLNSVCISAAPPLGVFFSCPFHALEYVFSRMTSLDNFQPYAITLIAVFVEALDKCFENVCELDLIFHSDKVPATFLVRLWFHQRTRSRTQEITVAAEPRFRCDRCSLHATCAQSLYR